MVIVWYLVTHLDCKVPCTAPTSAQLNDALWSECNRMIGRLPAGIKELFDWNTEYIRIKDSPSTWFARARTASKDKPEALAGIHAEDMLLIIDEASGVYEEVFQASKSAMTGARTIEIMISNPTRLEGTFYDSHHKMAESYQLLHFDGEESPIVDNAFVNDIILKHGKDSDEFKIRVKGLFPKEDDMDDAGFLPIVGMDEIDRSDVRLWGKKSMGVDPSGEGKDITSWVIRDALSAKIVAREPKSSEKSIAMKTLTLMTEYNVDPEDITIDNFGTGANVAQELALLGYRVNAVNVGDRTEDERFLNLRAEWYWRMREWLKAGGMLSNDEGWDELPKVKYKRNIQGKIQIMSKDEMRKRGIRSPNNADALMMTFRKDSNTKLANLANRNG